MLRKGVETGSYWGQKRGEVFFSFFKKFSLSFSCVLSISSTFGPPNITSSSSSSPITIFPVDWRKKLDSLLFFSLSWLALGRKEVTSKKLR